MCSCLSLGMLQGDFEARSANGLWFTNRSLAGGAANSRIVELKMEIQSPHRNMTVHVGGMAACVWPFI